MDKFSKLRGLIRENYKTEKAFALHIGMAPAILSRCLNCGRQWRGEEIAAACQALDIPLENAYHYNFFS